MRRLALVTLTFLTVSAFAQELVTSEASVDWLRGVVTVRLEQALTPEQRERPSGIASVRQEIIRNAWRPILTALMSVPLDSYYTVGAWIEEHEWLVPSLTTLARNARAVSNRSTVDLRRVEVLFEIDLYPDLARLFVTHDRVYPLPTRLGWVPTSEYSGIVIYCGGSLPLYGTTGERSLQPTLLPGIYDQQQLRLLEREYVDPAALLDWGPVAYSDTVDLEAYRDRIGDNPLYLIAYGVFGRYATDPVIATSDALAILATPSNRELLRAGRIVLIVDGERSRTDLLQP